MKHPSPNQVLVRGVLVRGKLCYVQSYSMLRLIVGIIVYAWPGSKLYVSVTDMPPKVKVIS